MIVLYRAQLIVRGKTINLNSVAPVCSMRQVLVAVCLVLVLLHVAECTRVIIAGQHYDVDNTP